MRFLHTTVVSLAMLLVAVEANSVTQFKQRSLIDLCGNVNADLNILGTIFGRISLCLCVSALPGLMQTNPILKSATVRYGQASVSAAVNNMISTASDYQQCNYPDHSVPLCSILNPCNFICTDGFIPSPIINPNTCACPAPLSVCNGVCGGFLSCSSPKAKRENVVQNVKRDSNWRDSFCPHGHSACGVLSSASGKMDYECVDVRSDLWSCGGCGIPLLPEDPVGTDCTSIPNVSDVACVRSRCVVSRCKAGYFLNEDKSECLRAGATSQVPPLFVENGRGAYKA